MANDLNQCQFIGRLGADPETRFTGSGDPVCSFRIAVGWKSKDKEGAEWVPCVAFGKLAEICGQYLQKGSQVFVQGRFRTEEYEKDGQKRYTTKIMLETMQMLGSKSQDSSQRQAASDEGYAPAPQRQAAPQRNSQGAQRQSFDDLGDDIPFAPIGRGIAGHAI